MLRHAIMHGMWALNCRNSETGVKKYANYKTRTIDFLRARARVCMMVSRSIFRKIRKVHANFIRPLNKVALVFLKKIK